MKITAVILAAGQGTRMRSSLPKVLHPIAGQPLLKYALEAVAGLSDEVPVVVVGHGADQVREVTGDAARFAVQEKQLGTANAVQAAEPLLSGKTDLVVVTNADLPLLTSGTLQLLVDMQKTNSGPISMLTVIEEDPRGFGRIVRGDDGTVHGIVEEADATPEQRAIRELNVGAYCFDSEWLWKNLRQVPVSPKGEYYLTDLIAMSVQQSLPVLAEPVPDPSETIGINTRVHLADAGALMRKRINTAWMEAGVTIVDPTTTFIEKSVELGQDTVIWPNTYLRGKTVIGKNCEIGPNSIIEDTQIGDDCKVLASVLEKAVLEDHVDIGPFGRLRKGAHLAKGVHMGNFGEVKDSYLGQGTKMGHFSYIGNAQIGKDVNIGAGTITCNYDGEKKHPTEIGDNVFIGSDTMLVAPVKLGDGARTGAGAVVTHDVPSNVVVVGVPAQEFKKLKNKDDN